MKTNQLVIAIAATIAATSAVADTITIDTMNAPYADQRCGSNSGTCTADTVVNNLNGDLFVDGGNVTVNQKVVLTT